MPWKRQTAFGKSSARSSTRSGSLGGGTAAAGRTWRSLQRPCSPSSAPKRSSQSPSSPIGIVPWLRSLSKLRRASSGQPVSFCRAAGLSTSSSSAFTGAVAAPLRSSNAATKSRSSVIPLATYSLEVFAEQGFVERLGALMLLLGLVQATTEDVERLVAARFGRVQPSIEHEPGEIAIVLEAAKNRPHFADHELEHGDLLVQELKNPLLQRIAGHEIEHKYLALLADSIDASDALLDRHRIPGHVEIDQRVAELDVAAFAARFSAKQHRHALAERGDGGVLVRAAQAALEAREGEAFPCQEVGDVSERLAIVDEDQFLFLRIAPQQLEQGRPLAAVGDRRPALRQRVPPRRIAVAVGEAPDGGRRGGRRRSRGAEQMLKREPASDASLGRQCACGRRQFLIGRTLPFRAVHADRHGVPTRQ